MPTLKRNPGVIDLFENAEAQSLRYTSAAAFTGLNKAMSAHYKRLKGVPLKDPKLYRREADMVREVMGLKTGSWDDATPDQLRTRQRLTAVLTACHDKNMGYQSRTQVLQQAKAILDIVDGYEF